MEKLEWWGYPTVKKLLDDMCNHLDTIPVCDGRWTDILPRHSAHYTYASLGKKCKYVFKPQYKYIT